VLRPHFDAPGPLEMFRGLYRAQRHLVMPMLLDDDTAANLRARLLLEGVERFSVADRGSYREKRQFRLPPLFDPLRQLAEKVVEAPLAELSHQWLCFARGDYQLMRGDAVERGATGRHLELTLDFSAREIGQGEIVYSDERGEILVPQMKHALALVERHDSMYRYERYLNHLVGEAEVWRLRLWLEKK